MNQNWRSWDWARIGVYLAAARENRHQSRPEVARAIGVSPDSIGNIENARKVSRRKPPTAAKLAAYYGWTADSLEAVGNGGEPTLIAPEDRTPPAGGPLTDGEVEAGILALDRATWMSEDTKARLIADWRRRARQQGGSNHNNATTG